jgi:hypothetical protein
MLLLSANQARPAANGKRRAVGHAEADNRRCCMIDGILRPQSGETIGTPQIVVDQAASSAPQSGELPGPERGGKQEAGQTSRSRKTHDRRSQRSWQIRESNADRRPPSACRPATAATPFLSAVKSAGWRTPTATTRPGHAVLAASPDPTARVWSPASHRGSLARFGHGRARRTAHLTTQSPLTLCSCVEKRPMMPGSGQVLRRPGDCLTAAVSRACRLCYRLALTKARSSSRSSRCNGRGSWFLTSVLNASPARLFSLLISSFLASPSAVSEYSFSTASLRTRHV